MHPAIRNLLIVALAAFVVACNPMEQLGDADAAVAKFHEQMDKGQFDAIWEGAHEDFRKASPKAPATKFLADVHTRMGKMKSTEREGFNLNTNNGVTTVKVTHKTEFENGPATETFDYIRKDDRLELWNYNINWGLAGPPEPGAGE
ncbi:MAG: hypothetical protein H6920_06920 [Sphingomonadaceae bacterium]|nr:hypothetical protein [Altererythrobacter sp.]MCP5391335.1 hypothetical protein [Sphingomonadaceae bacterium]MCP5394937.1 hypothetical protein [Sphingomonadaceae bacterium]